MSRYHVEALRTLDFVEIIAVCDTDRIRANQLAAKVGCRAAVELSALEPLRPDVIHVLTPPSTHCELTIQALKMGCDVLVEKPMAPTAAECDRMIAVAEQTGRVLSVDHSARMDPIILRALEKVRCGACGDVLAVDYLRSSEYPPYSGGPLPEHLANAAYPFEDMGVHAFSVLEAFLGQIQDLNIRSESTERTTLPFLDEWHALVSCEKGTGRLYLSWNVRPIQNEVIIYATRGVIHVDCVLQTCVVRRAYPVPKWIGRPVAGFANSFTMLGSLLRNVGRLVAGRIRRSPGIDNAIREFYFALREHRPAPISSVEGRRLTVWIERATREAKDDERVRVARRRVALPPSRVLVTGSSGCLGSALLARLLRDGQSPRVLLRRSVPHIEADPRITVVYGDLGDPDAVSRAVDGVEIVYHLGAAMHGQPADFERSTIWGTRNVVDACVKHRAKRLVHVSTLSVLDHANQPSHVTESAPLEPYPGYRGDYTKSKLVAEGFIREAIRGGRLSAVILRPGMIFGAGATPPAPSGAFVVRGSWIVMGSGQFRLPLVYIDDVVDALLLAADSDQAAGGTFHLVDDPLVTQREYIDRCRRHHSHIPPPRYVPGSLLVAVALVTSIPAWVIGYRILSKYRVKSLRPLSHVDHRAATDVLGWRPAVGIVEGLRRAFGDADLAPRLQLTWRSY